MPTVSPSLQAAYERNENDEFVQPTALHDAQQAPRGIGPKDSVVFMNFFADRARQLTRTMTEHDFTGFERRSFAAPASFITTRYADSIPLPCAFAPEICTTRWANIYKTTTSVSCASREEKYAHVTFFFSGGREEPFDGRSVSDSLAKCCDVRPATGNERKKVTDQLVRPSKAAI